MNNQNMNNKMMNNMMNNMNNQNMMNNMNKMNFNPNMIMNNNNMNFNMNAVNNNANQKQTISVVLHMPFNIKNKQVGEKLSVNNIDPSKPFVEELYRELSQLAKTDNIANSMLQQEFKFIFNAKNCNLSSSCEALGLTNNGNVFLVQPKDNNMMVSIKEEYVKHIQNKNNNLSNNPNAQAMSGEQTINVIFRHSSAQPGQPAPVMLNVKPSTKLSEVISMFANKAIGAKNVVKFNPEGKYKFGFNSKWIDENATVAQLKMTNNSNVVVMEAGKDADVKTLSQRAAAAISKPSPASGAANNKTGQPQFVVTLTLERDPNLKIPGTPTINQTYMCHACGVLMADLAKNHHNQQYQGKMISEHKFSLYVGEKKLAGTDFDKTLATIGINKNTNIVLKIDDTGKTLADWCIFLGDKQQVFLNSEQFKGVRQLFEQEPWSGVKQNVWFTSEQQGQKRIDRICKPEEIRTKPRSLETYGFADHQGIFHGSIRVVTVGDKSFQVFMSYDQTTGKPFLDADGKPLYCFNINALSQDKYDFLYEKKLVSGANDGDVRYFALQGEPPEVVSSKPYGFVDGKMQPIRSDVHRVEAVGELINISGARDAFKKNKQGLAELAKQMGVPKAASGQIDVSLLLLRCNEKMRKLSSQLQDIIKNPSNVINEAPETKNNGKIKPEKADHVKKLQQQITFLSKTINFYNKNREDDINAIKSELNKETDGDKKQQLGTIIIKKVNMSKVFFVFIYLS